MNKPQYPPEYRTILRRWTDLMYQGALTGEEWEEIQRLDAQLDAYELAYKQASVFETVASDYADLRHTGDLGGVEGL